MVLPRPRGQPGHVPGIEAVRVIVRAGPFPVRVPGARRESGAIEGDRELRGDPGRALMAPGPVDLETGAPDGGTRRERDGDIDRICLAGHHRPTIRRGAERVPDIPIHQPLLNECEWPVTGVRRATGSDEEHHRDQERGQHDHTGLHRSALTFPRPCSRARDGPGHSTDPRTFTAVEYPIHPPMIPPRTPRPTWRALYQGA